MNKIKDSRFVIIYGIFVIFFSGCTNHYEEGVKLFNNIDYKKAKIELLKVPSYDRNFNKAQLLIAKYDSTENANRIQYHNEKSKAKPSRDSLKIVNQIIELKEIIHEINHYDTGYRDNVNSIMVEVANFSFWAKIGLDNKNSNNKTIKKLSKRLLSNLKTLQIKQFPQIRKKWAKALDAKLWESDIDAVALGSRKTIIMFTGGTFSINRNIKDWQSSFRGHATDLRFNQIRYKWSDYSDEYQYYDISSPKDSELIVL